MLTNMYATLQRVWLGYFWTKPDNLWALKVCVSIALLVVPCCYVLDEPFWGTTLALGVVGAALAETDDHPRGRLKTLTVTILSFFIVSLSVELLKPYPWLFAAGLAVTTFVLILLGGVSPRYQCVTFGSLLVSIYAMLGVGIKPWYYQPILLPLGGLVYGSISLLLLYVRPYRLLKEQLSSSYRYLADYVHLKSTLFPSAAKEQKRIRTALARKNVEIGRSIDTTKQVIYLFIAELEKSHKDMTGLSPYYNKWLVLQQLHERAASSHERYDRLSRNGSNAMLIEGYGRMLAEIADALRIYADTLLTGEHFECPISLRWTSEALHTMLLQDANNKDYQSLLLLYENLQRISTILQNVDMEVRSLPIETLEYRPAPLMKRISALFDVHQARFRHAVRLTLCFLLGWLIINIVDLEKGDWVILTSLFVCQQSYTATRQRLFERITGTFVGVISGVLLSNILPTMEGQIVLLLSAIFLFFFCLRKKYYVAVSFITIFVLAAFNIQTGMGVDLMIPRLLDTLVGALIAYMAVRFVWPDWNYKHLPQLMHTAIYNNQRYFDTIYESEERGQVYYHNRRAAHQADNALTTAWRGMFLEPKTKRFLQKRAFTLTYLNHTLLSYISALGAHYYSKSLSMADVTACRQISATLSSVMTMLDKGGYSDDISTGMEATEAHSLTSELRRRKLAESDDPVLGLLYNIAHVSNELLSEVAEFEKKKMA